MHVRRLRYHVGGRADYIDDSGGVVKVDPGAPDDLLHPYFVIKATWVRPHDLRPYLGKVWVTCLQWRRQDLLRGGAKIEIIVMGQSRWTSWPGAAAAR